MQYRIEGKKKNGHLKVRFRFWENGKLVTITPKLLQERKIGISFPNSFKTEKSVKDFKDRLSSYFDYKTIENKNFEKWTEKYYNFKSLIEIFEDYSKKEAPRSYSSKNSYFKYYVLEYFLQIKGLENLESWKDQFEDFKKWLSKTTQKRVKSNKSKTLSPNSQNHCIQQLNSFLQLMFESGKCTKQPLCRKIKDAQKKSEKNISYIITDDEAEDIYKFLFKINKYKAYAFWFLLKTGMRVSEARGIGPANIAVGKIPHLQLNKLLADNDMSDYSGYIFFNSQVDKKSTLRSKNHKIVFIPLKSRSDISVKNTRYVPINDNRLLEIIIEMTEKVQLENEVGKWGSDIKQYTFFYEYLSSAIMNSDLKMFYDKNKKSKDNKYKAKTCHDCRHTYAVYTGRKDITGTLQKIILGHCSSAAQRYYHMNEDLYNETENKKASNNIFNQLKKLKAS